MTFDDDVDEEEQPRGAAGEAVGPQPYQFEPSDSETESETDRVERRDAELIVQNADRVGNTDW